MEKALQKTTKEAEAFQDKYAEGGDDPQDIMDKLITERKACVRHQNKVEVLEAKLRDSQSQIKTLTTRERTLQQKFEGLRGNQKEASAKVRQLQKTIDKNTLKIARKVRSGKNTKQRLEYTKAKNVKAQEAIAELKAKNQAAAIEVQKKYLDHIAELEKGLEEMQEILSRNPRAIPTTKQGGRYTDSLRMMIYDLAPKVAMNQVPDVVRIVFQFVGIHEAKIPSTTTVRYMVAELMNIAQTHVAHEVANSGNVGITFDGTQKAGKLIVSTHFSTPGKLLFAGYTQSKGKKAEHTKECLELVTQSIRERGGQAFGAKVAEQVNLMRIMGGNNGSGAMTDHASGEDRVKDLLEEDFFEEMKKDESFNKKSKEEQQEYVKIHRRYCLMHKWDNLAKALISRYLIKALWELMGWGDVEHDRGRAKDAILNDFMYACQKLIGKGTHDLCIFERFGAFLQAKVLDKELENDEIMEAEMAIKVHRILGRGMVGERMWALHKNADCILYLLNFINEFLQQRFVSMGNQENLLQASVRANAKSTGIKVLLIVQAIFYHSLLRPGLKTSTTCSKPADAQAIIQALQAFLDRCSDETPLKGAEDNSVIKTQGCKYIWDKLMQNPMDGAPESFLSKERFQEICPLSEESRFRFEYMHNTLQEAGYEVQLGVFVALKIGIAHLDKVNSDMSGDLIKGTSATPYTAMPSVVTWCVPTASTGYSSQLNRADLVDNIGDERSFARLGQVLARNSAMKLHNASGIEMSRQNKTVEWLRGLPRDKQEQVMAACASTKAVQDQRKRGSAREKEIQTGVMQQQEREFQLGRDKVQKQQDKLDMIYDRTKVWTKETYQANIAAAEWKSKSANDKVKEIQQMFQVLQAWGKKVIGNQPVLSDDGQKALQDHRPADSKAKSWEDALDRVLQIPEVATIRSAANAEKARKDSDVGGGGGRPASSMVGQHDLIERTQTVLETVRASYSTPHRGGRVGVPARACRGVRLIYLDKLDRGIEYGGKSQFGTHSRQTY